MKRRIIFATLAAASLLGGCANNNSEGDRSPSQGVDSTVVYKINKVIQNDVDVKPYFGFFDKVMLTLTYKDNLPSTLTLVETDAPFRVTPFDYTSKLEINWKIENSQIPNEIRVKETGELFGYISSDGTVTLNFTLGCPSNKYEYQLVPVTE